MAETTTATIQRHKSFYYRCGSEPEAGELIETLEIEFDILPRVGEILSMFGSETTRAWSGVVVAVQHIAQPRSTHKGAKRQAIRLRVLDLDVRQ